MDCTNLSLTILLNTTTVVLIVLTVFIVRFLINATNLASGLTKASTMLTEELEPTLKELNETLSSINTITKAADEELAKARGTFNNAMKIPIIVGTKIKGLFGGFVEGVSAGIKMFRK